MSVHRTVLVLLVGACWSSGLLLLFSAEAAGRPAGQGRMHPVPSGDHPGVKTSALRGRIALTHGSAALLVSYPSGQEAFARYVLSATTMYLPAVERYLAAPLARSNIEIRILEGGGSNKGDWIEIGPGSPGNPALLFHELNHYWFWYSAPGRQIWLIEGLMSFLPWAMDAAGFLKLTAAERASIPAGWGFTWRGVPPAFPPLLVDDGGPFRYPTTYKLQYIVHHELGSVKYRSCLHAMARAWPLKDVAAFLAILDGQRHQDWRALLGGWLFNAPFGRIKPADFLDSDRDGLNNLAESGLGTDPARADSDRDGYADGWEVAHGFNPADPRSRPVAGVPVVDGVADAVAGAPLGVVDDPVGDSRDRMDIRRVSVWRAGELLFLRVVFHRNDPRSTYCTVRLQSMEGGNFWLQTWNTDPAVYWGARFREGEPFSRWANMPVVPKLEMACLDVFELLFRPADFGLRGRFRILFHAGGFGADGKPTFHADESDWLTVAWGE